MTIRIAAICMMLTPSVVAAEIEFSLYGGIQTAPSSNVTVTGDSAIPDASFEQSWEGQSFEWPIYGGARITYWQSATFGFGLDYAHNKTNPSDEQLPAGYQALEFTDGLNTWTINAYQRWPGALNGATPYIGAGLGISAPGVEVRYAGSETFEYQVTGPAATWLAGISYPINDTWALFGEYKGTYTQNDVALVGGGSLQSDIFTNALNVGITYSY